MNQDMKNKMFSDNNNLLLNIIIELQQIINYSKDNAIINNQEN